MTTRILELQDGTDEQGAPGMVLPKVSYAQCGFSPIEGDAITVFASYWDESGTHNQHLLVVAGFTAQIDKWADFSVKWKALLAENRVRYFHAKEFRNSKSRAFAHLSAQQKNGFLSQIVALINETALVGNWATVSPAIYNRLSTPKYRNEFSTSYAWCAINAVGVAVGHLQRHRPGNQRVGIFFEEGHKNLGQALDLIRLKKSELEEIEALGFDDAVLDLGDPNPGSQKDPLRRDSIKIGAIGSDTKDGMPPLQAADLLASCLYWWARYGDNSFSFPVLEAIHKAIPLYGIDLTEEKIKRCTEATTTAEDNWRAYLRELHEFRRDMKSLGVSVERVTDAGVGIRGPGHLLPQAEKILVDLMRRYRTGT